MGILSGLQSMLAKANTGTPDKPSFVDRLNTFGANLQDISDGGDRVQNMQKVQATKMKAQQEAEQRKALAEYADKLGLSPKQRFLLMVKPELLGDLIKDQESPFSLSEGQQRYNADGTPIAVAPKTITIGDQIVSASPNGVNPLFTRPKTYAEMQKELQDTLNNGFERERIGISRGQLGVSQGGLALERAKHAARMAAGGYGTPGVGAVIGPSLGADWEEVK